ncbi:hypothetical protein AB6806_27600 [Bosea sp. RCC_152_1]|uniref:glycine-rich domain-containing protein n=1 Tax=Bosea sp. RCC_152_1 TaxID=3239228 RepID=UPI003525C804
MPTNDFLPFASAGGANVLSQADYLVLAARLAGFVDGVAMPEEANKAWRQSAAMATMIGRFIADHGGLDALDNSDIDTLLANFISTYRSQKANVITVGGTATALVGTLNSPIVGYSVGITLRAVMPAAAVGGGTTLALNGGPPFGVVRPGGGAIQQGDWLAADIVQFAWNGTSWQIMSPLVGESLKHFIQTFDVSGTYTVGAGIYWIFIECWGGGGGGGGANGPGAAGSGGGPGGHGYGWYPVTPGQVLTVTVGVGGAGGTVSVAAGFGGTSSVGSLISCTGGGPGVASSSGPQNTFFGASGTCTGGNAVFGGVPGGYAYQIASGQLLAGQGGGAARSTGSTVSPSNVVGVGGNFPGGGASGSNANGPGGTGAGGRVIITC